MTPHATAGVGELPRHEMNIFSNEMYAQIIGLAHTGLMTLAGYWTRSIRTKEIWLIYVFFPLG